MAKTKNPRRLTLLIDADVLAYTASSGEQRVYEWDVDCVSVECGTLEEAQSVVQHQLDEWMTHFNASHYELCLSDDNGYFRHALYPPYKGNRKVKPVLLPEVRKWMLEKLGAWKRPKLEGDDVMGILATHPHLIKGKKVIVSIDKDMRQIPGTLYNPGKDTVEEIDVETGEYFHAFQTLCGDATDCYPGIRNVGPVKARAILDAPREEWWPRMVEAATTRGMTEDELLVQARIARILRHGEFNYHTKEPILWQPSRS